MWLDPELAVSVPPDKCGLARRNVGWEGLAFVWWEPAFV